MADSSLRYESWTLAEPQQELRRRHAKFLRRKQILYPGKKFSSWYIVLQPTGNFVWTFPKIHAVTHFVVKDAVRIHITFLLNRQTNYLTE